MFLVPLLYLLLFVCVSSKHQQDIYEIFLLLGLNSLGFDVRSEKKHSLSYCSDLVVMAKKQMNEKNRNKNSKHFSTFVCFNNHQHIV